MRNPITMAAVLELLGFRAKSTNGSQLRGACPLHGSTSGTSRCFSANVDDHVYRCFKCGRSGNALDLWSAATKQPPYDAAIDLCGRLNVGEDVWQETRGFPCPDVSAKVVRGDSWQKSATT